MKKLTTKLALGAFLLSQPLVAAVFCPIDSVIPVTCEFSIQHHNRILVEGGRIKKIIFPEDQLAVRLEETSGQAFVQARQNSREKVMLSIIASGGLVQDIEIEFKEGPSQVVVLQSPYETLPLCQSPSLSVCPYNPVGCDDSQRVISQIVNGGTPAGYESVQTVQSSWKVSSGVKAKLMGCLKGRGENLFIYQVRNNNFWKKCISENAFKCACPSWVYIENEIIPSRGTTLAIVAVPA